MRTERSVCSQSGLSRGLPPGYMPYARKGERVHIVLPKGLTFIGLYRPICSIIGHCVAYRCVCAFRIPVVVRAVHDRYQIIKKYIHINKYVLCLVLSRPDYRVDIRIFISLCLDEIGKIKVLRSIH